MNEIEPLLPHRPPMLFLDALLEGDDTSALARAEIRSDTPFFDPGRGLPSWVLLEHFAQTAALVGGLRARQRGGQAMQGFLVGASRFDSNVEYLPAGMQLNIEAREEMADSNGMALFGCRTLHPDYRVSCSLSVFIPAEQANHD